MDELDSLINDLDRSRLSAGSLGRNNSQELRPTVDALLNELSNAVHKYIYSLSLLSCRASFIYFVSDFDVNILLRFTVRSVRALAFKHFRSFCTFAIQ